MDISKERITELAHAAQIGLSPEETARFAEDLTALTALADALLEIPMNKEGRETDGIDAVSLAALREDRVAPCLPRETALHAAPHSRDGYFVVPRTVED